MVGSIFLFNLILLLSSLSITLTIVLLILVMIIIYNKLFKKPIINLNVKTKKEWSKERHYKGEDASDPNQDFNEVHTYFNIICNYICNYIYNSQCI